MYLVYNVMEITEMTSIEIIDNHIQNNQMEHLRKLFKNAPDEISFDMVVKIMLLVDNIHILHVDEITEEFNKIIQQTEQEVDEEESQEEDHYVCCQVASEKGFYECYVCKYN